MGGLEPSAPGRLLRAGPVSATYRTTLEGGGVAYRKVYSVAWPWLPLAGLLKANMPPLDALQEARNAERLLALGIEAPRPIARGASWRLDLRRPAVRRDSFVLLEEVRGTPLDRALRSAAPAERRRIAEEAGRTIGLMHRASVYHRDLYLCHLLWDGASGRLGLIDVARARRRRWLRGRFRVKDLAALAVSARGFATRTDIVRFLRAYFGDRRLSRTARRLCARVLRKAARMARHGDKA